MDRLPAPRVPAGRRGCFPTVATRRHWHEPALVAVSIVVWLVATAWARPLLLPDEGRYVGVAWEMIRSGNWLTPTLDGLPFFHKPPLFYWITAGSMSLFGPNELAARAAPILGAWIGAFALYLFVRRWSGERAARGTALTLLAQPLFYIGGQFANLDMLVGGCITATIVSLAHCALCVERGLPCRRTLLGAYAFAALGVLAKGLIGAVVPALVILAWLVAMRRWQPLKTLVSPSGAALFMAIASPWFIAMQWRFDGYLHYFFVVQHFERFASGGFNNVQPFWFYPAVLVLFSLPWLPWLYRSIRGGSPGLESRRPIRFLMWIWAAVVTLFFSLPASKLLGYILPAIPPLAFLMADGYLNRGAPSARATRLWWASATLAMILNLGGVAYFALREGHSTHQLAAKLRAQRGPDEPVFMIDHYYYDVPFYARLSQPVGVVDDWTSPEVRKFDNWRKELADAEAFLPPQEPSSLIRPGAFAATLCRARINWVIGSPAVTAHFPFLSDAQVVMTNGDTTLWRVDSAARAPGLLQCPAPTGELTAIR
jgi:4-amino-4-deoxy-L-arabinose transferase-like glycosyltransferase